MNKFFIFILLFVLSKFCFSSQVTNSVVVELITNEDGQVTIVNLVKSSNNKELDDKALQIGKNTKFLPTIIDNQKVKIKTNLQLSFDLNNKSTNNSEYEATYISVRPLNLTLKVISEPNIDSCYPSFSKRAREQGLVILDVIVNEDGKVIKTEVKSSSNYVRLDAAANRCAEKFIFQVPVINNKPVKVSGPMWFRFNLASP